LRLGQSEEQTGGRQRASILEDALEAVVGAIFLDSDFATVRAGGARLVWPVARPARRPCSKHFAFYQLVL